MNKYFYVIYDYRDFVLGCFDNEQDVLNFSGMRKDNFRSRIKKGYCYYQANGNYNIIYRFREV